MALSDSGDHPMTKLSDTQAVILSAAAQRDDLSVLPLPETLKIKGGAVDKVLGGLKPSGLIGSLGAPRGDDPPPLVSPAPAWPAIGVEPRTTPEAPTAADTGATSAEAAVRLSTPRPATEADGAATPARSKAKAKARRQARQGRAGREAHPARRHQAGAVIELLRRPEGATVEQIAEATGWQHHTIRGAISGALKKKLGLTVEATRTREVGPNKTGAKGSSTVYRIVKAG